MNRYQQISDATAFDAADKFNSPEAVRAYFSVKAQRDMFGADAVTDQDVLDQMAEDVIEHRWHCAFIADVPAVAEVVRDHGEVAHGSENPEVVAREWVEHGFDAADVRAWLGAHCSQPRAAAALRDRGITPQDAKLNVLAGRDGMFASIGHKTATGDLTVDEAVRLAEQARRTPIT